MTRRLTGSGEQTQTIPASELRVDDVVPVQAGDLIPSDGEVAQAIASVDESASAGESAPVIRKSGGDRSAVTGGRRLRHLRPQRGPAGCDPVPFTARTRLSGPDMEGSSGRCAC